MNYNKVLIAEDDIFFGNLLKDMLRTNNYDVTLAQNGRQALEMYRKEPYSVVLTDIEMPVMDGYEFVTKLKEMDDESVIFILTSNSESGFIIDVMKKGIYDYIIKPVDMGELLLKIKRAFERYELNKIKEVAEKERSIRLNNQLEWVRWQNRVQSKNTKVDKDLFHNIHVSFSQGTGFGSLLTLLNIIVSKARLEGDEYVLDKEMMNVVKRNTELAQDAVDTFAKIEWIISNDLPLKEVTCKRIYSLLEETKEELERFCAPKKNKIIISDKKPVFDRRNVYVDEKTMKSALYELLINALKFSDMESEIYVIFDIYNDYLSVSIINEPMADSEGKVGIPLEYEYIVFEPFFRMFKTVFENYETFDYGLGLTMVDKIIEKHNGKVSVKNVVDHTQLSRGAVTKVEFTIILPLSF